MYYHTGTEKTDWGCILSGIGSALLLGLVILLLLSTSGCGHYAPPLSTGTDNAIGRIVARADVIEHTTREEISRTQAQAIKLDAKDAAANLDGERKLSRELSDYKVREEASWIGPRTKRLGWWTLGVVLAVICTYGFIGAWYAPAAWAVRLLRLVPPPLTFVFNNLAYVIGRKR